MSGDVHVRFCEGPGVRFPRATRRNVFVRSQAAGERVMASLERFLWKRLRLKINREKSAVTRPWTGRFLGYTVTSNLQPRVKVAPKSIQRLKANLKPFWRRARGRRLADTIADLNLIIRGWVGYYRLADVRATFEELDPWVRRKLRCILWRQWKTPRTRYKKLRSAGVDAARAQCRCHEPPRSMVERRGKSHESSRIDPGAAKDGTRELPR